MLSVDEDGSGSIDFRELVGMLSAREQAKMAENEIVEAFRVLAKMDVSATLQGIGREGVTEALNSLSVEGLEHDAVLTEQVVTNMMGWMNGEDQPGGGGSDTKTSIEVFRERMLGLVTQVDAASTVELVANPVEEMQLQAEGGGLSTAAFSTTAL